MKVCKKCGKEKPLSQFRKFKQMKDGNRNECKSCEKEYKKEYRENNKEIEKKYREKNKEKAKERAKKYYEENKDKVKERTKKYHKNRYKTDPLFRLSCNIRNMVRRAIKTKRTEEIIGCSFKHLKHHLEQQFTDGMSWDNYGEWQIDHIRPLSWFDITNPDEVDKANHYSNLQPMWAEENLSKNNRFEGDTK